MCVFQKIIVNILGAAFKKVQLIVRKIMYTLSIDGNQLMWLLVKINLTQLHDTVLNRQNKMIPI